MKTENQHFRVLRFEIIVLTYYLGWAKEKLRRGWDRDEADEGIELVRNAARGGGDCVLKTAAGLDVERNDLEMEPRREAIPAVCL